DFNRADPKETWQRGAFRAGLTEEAAAFAWSIVDGVLAHRKELDREIAALAPEFPIDQMARIDRNVLRIALYELRISGDAPAGVARKWDVATTFPDASRTRQLTFASNTRADPASRTSYATCGWPATRSPGLGALTAMRSLVACGSPPISTTSCVLSGMYARQGRASSSSMKEYGFAPM